MIRTLFSKVSIGAMFTLALLAGTSQVHAGWRWHGSHGGSHGSWGGSSGSWGSYGGSSGSWGSYGGHWGHKHWRHAGYGGSSGGSYGSWGSSGGSSGSWGSSGGSSGGSYYYAPMEVQPAPSAPVPSGEAPPAPAPAPGTSTSIQSSDGLLAVSVPEDAKIYVNGQATTSTGSQRQYVSRNLAAGNSYSYEVRAEVVRDGRTVEQVRQVELRSGETARLAFDFPAAASPETSLTVHVPADAKVYLAGNPTKASGPTRVFRTTGLTGGKSWEGYMVRVELERGGVTLTKEEKITLQAGQSQELSFEFDGDKIASAVR
jgi:uncharacterized protein (TIGR03000 family)